ncbi:ATP-binding cassette protein subfamily A, member 6 [Leishmania infantum JPCM5]|uniref:ATP-binding cassette protein subfamily A, member 6 n=2 Tax=Leishmania infantum TaxID=5671 RepID=A4HV35_LEIIN|nr:ATP-binding cassette protein subfamily A, member 6 [Leishmania infantum JPCM5]CAC9461754.1 ATP-binding_cassette_subfamily_A_-_member_1_-_putative [Leishmania infantum]CAM66300.1 ATP-binding cassette protein subfamily A, member 6 [Leishmania infantum JPCM5]SUZ39911.1 ATP-binding_cassette_subfamily_A_-_member_1_-_putative [Leishmania infantum]|eukprot:XP_001463926.1 ATP-binding cassette protein subfamily A, member 6 [Leishmania infantum JPCM5]
MERTIQQKQRAWVGTVVELLIPFLFLIGAIILWCVFGEEMHPEKQVLNYTAVSSLTIPGFYREVACNNVSMGIIPGIEDCTTVPYSYNCSGDESSLPVKGLCFSDTLSGARLIALYLNAILGNAVRVPPLDTIIMMQWIARKFARDITQGVGSAALAATGIMDNTRYGAIMNSGMLYFAPRASVPASLIDYLNDTTDYFRYVYGGTFDTLEEAENHVETTPGFHWAIVEVNAFNSTDFDVVLHMNPTSLPPLTKVVDAQYPGGYHFDRSEMYTASGFNSLQEALYQCYLHDLGYTDGELIHPYSTSLGYRSYKEKKLLKTASVLVAFLLVLSFLHPVSQLTKKIVLEKELRIREAMLIMGLSSTSLHLSWLVTYALQYLSVCIGMTVLMKLTFAPSSDAFVLLMTLYLFAMSTIPLSGLIAAFFSKARLASMLAPLIYFVLSVPTFASSSISANVIIGMSLLSPTAFAAALTNILTLEVATGFGPNHFKSAALTPESSMLYAFLAADFVLYYILMLYLDAVLPKQWGTRKHPLFFIMEPVRWFSGPSARVLEGGADGRAEDGVFEEITEGGADYAVCATGLRKEYSRGGKRFVAVNNLYWGMREGEISVLLGHNGAGKTTVLNMMTGMVEPDAGDCYINGSSVRNELNQVRRQIGYCPQHNILWGELTCREHLEYYGKIKGLFGGVLEDVVRRILNEVDLLDKMEYPSRALSGGQKRKLSVAIAFVGLSPLVFLDEPTAGMDVGARRYTWELLRRMSEAHTIMLTTHYMDEADLLGHKIGIMSRGRMQCSGSSMFLKSRLGVGYNIVISVDPEVDAEAIDRLVVSLVPGAEASCFNGCEIVYKLPMRDLELFPSLLESLEENGKDAGVRGYSLSATTLEEVFLQIVMDEMKNHKASTAVEENEEVVEEENNAVWNCEMMTGTRQRLVSQFKAMMVKRLQNALRDRKMQCFQVVCPVVCVMVAMLLTLFSFTEAGSLSLTSEMFGETVQMQVSGCEKYFGATNNVTRQGSYITDLNFANGQDLSFYATDTAKQLTMPRYTSLFCGDPGLQHVVPFEFDATFLFYNTSAYHAGGLVLQQLYTYILQSFTNNVHRTFKTGAKPMPTTMRDSSVKDGVQTILMGAIIMIPFTFLPSNVVAWVVKERECKARHLQNVSGLSFYIYWLTNFLFDMVAYVMTLSLVLLIFLMFSRDEYVGKNTAGPAIVVFLIYGLCSTVSAYVVSFGFHEHSAAQSATMAVNFVAGFLLVMMVFILSLVDSTAKISRNLRWPFRLVPSYCVGESIINLAMDRQQAALNLPSNPWAMEVVGWPCVFMAIEFPIFLLATLFIDHPRRRMWGQTGSYDRCAPAEVVDDEDSDVEDEREEVYQQEKKNVNMDVVRVVDLRKVYPNGKVAVRNLAFSILPDEVFGFLGTNGAGKTTTISMLCQEFIPTSGNAYVCGYDIVTESEQALQCIGYCPQFDATLDLLTVEEHLHLYAGIRGILYEQRSKVVAGLMRLCDITEFRDTMSAQLSGGNRRKLSVALSLIGGPRVVFLDEPSAGMDPVARRGLWTAIQKVSQNCSVVLTTHHLEEVEALADTVGIMADGALRCIGDKIHLKQKYGSGFELSVRVAQRDVRAAVQRFVGENFPAAVLNEFKGKRLVFALPQDTKLSEAFWQLQQNKRRLHITDYTVSQTSIEQVFLRISEQQEERDELGKKKVTHFVKSHATPHAYNGVATKKKRRQEPAEKTVLVSSAAMEAYRRRKLMAGIVDEVARSEKNDRIGRHGEEESDEVDNAVRNFNTAGSQCAPARRGSVSNVHGASSGRKRCAVNFVAAAGEDPSAGHATPYSNTYGPSSEGQAYGHGYDYDSSSGYGYPNQYNGNGESFRYDYGYNLHTGGAAGHQQPQNAYNSYCGGGKTKYS